MTFSVVIDGYIYTSGVVFYYPSSPTDTGPNIGSNAAEKAAQKLAVADDLADIRCGPVIEEYDPGKGFFIQGWS